MSSLPSLTIISHTPHYYNIHGEVVGLEPTLREINQLSLIFDTIYHIAPLYKGRPHKATIKYTFDEIIFIPLIPTGGKSILNKLGIIFFLPYNLFHICKIIRRVDWIHFRAPTNLGIYVLPLLSIYRNKRKWIKYAGNWSQKSIPISYKLQRWWLRNNFQNSKVTINGSVNRQKSHLIPFYNPCLTEKEINFNKEFGSRKNFNGKLTFCFVGRLEKSKGLPALLKAFDNLNKITWIDKLHCVGEIIDEKIISKYDSSDRSSIVFHGILDRLRLNTIYAESHFIILPSESEGFPKVLAEASSFGCIPIFPSIKSILLQFNDTKKNGIVLKNITSQGIIETIENLQLKRGEFAEFSKNAMEGINEFSYEVYNKRILNEIIQN